MDYRPWLANYPAGIPANINADQYDSLLAFIQECFNNNGKKEAFECMGAVLTYDKLDKLSTNFGAYLQSRGLEKGDKIALMMPNLLQYPVALFGALKAGLTIVNTNPLYTPREMEHQFTDSNVKAIVIAENFAINLQQVIKKTEINIVLTASIGGMLGAIKGRLTNFVVRKIKRMVPTYNIPNTVTVKDAIKQGSKFTLTDVESRGEDVIVHQYTGGTTGVAKGAMLTNRNLLANMLQIKAWLSNSMGDGKNVTLSPLPMYHIFAFTVNCMAMMSYGAKTILIVNARDLGSIIKEFKNHKINVMTGVNTLFNALLNNEKFNTIDFSELKITVAGGMALQNTVATKWKDLTGCTLSEGYGMTESSPVASVNPVDGTAIMGTIGLPVPSTDMRVVDESGIKLGVGESGEIQIKGPQVMKGYYNKPEETANTIKDGWLCTGDIGMMDTNGFFKIVDRKKDMILVSGFNVYPNEIEEVIAQHPKVLEVAAIGIPSEKSGEVVKVFIVRKDKSLKEKEIITFCKQHCTGYKVPKEIEFRDELPKSNVGKILRRKLRNNN